MLDQLLTWLSDYKLNVALTVLLVVVYLLFRRFIIPRFRAKAAHGRLKDEVISKAM